MAVLRSLQRCGRHCCVGGARHTEVHSRCGAVRTTARTWRCLAAAARRKASAPKACARAAKQRTGGLTAAEVPAATVGGWPTGVSVCMGRVALTAPYGVAHCKGIDSTSTSQACGPPCRVRLPTLPRTALIAISRTQTQVRPKAYSLALSALPVRAGTADHSV